MGLVAEYKNQWTPIFRILADGSNITEIIQDRLLSLRLRDEVGFESDDVEIVLDDRDHSIELPNVGAELDISLGYRETELTHMGLFRVDEVELSSPPMQMVIRAKAANFAAGKSAKGLLQTQKTRAWDEVSLADVVKKISDEHNYKAVVDKHYEQIRFDHIDQTAESDLHLLIRLAKEYGAVVKPMDTYLCFVAEGKTEKADGESLPLLELAPADIFTWRVALSYRKAYAAVKAKWHDKILAKTLSLTVGEGEPVFEISHLHNNEKAAYEAAQSTLKKSQRGNATINLSLSGCLEASAKRKLKLMGFRGGVDGEWICQKVEHQLNSSGFSTTIEGEIFTE